MVQAKRRAKPKKAKRPREPKYMINTGDAWGMFPFKGLWKLSNLVGSLNELVAKIEFVPGLVVKDEDGKLWRPTLQLRLVAVDPEES